MAYPIRGLHAKTRPAPYTLNEMHKIKQIPQLKETLHGSLPRMLLRNLPKDCTQVNWLLDRKIGKFKTLFFV